MTHTSHDFGTHSDNKFCRRTACRLAAALADRNPCRGDKPEPPAPTTLDLADEADLFELSDELAARRAHEDAADLIDMSDELAALVCLYCGGDKPEAAAEWLAAYLLGEAEITGRRAPHLVHAIEYEIRAAGWHEAYPLRQFHPDRVSRVTTRQVPRPRSWTERVVTLDGDPKRPRGDTMADSSDKVCARTACGNTVSYVEDQYCPSCACTSCGSPIEPCRVGHPQCLPCTEECLEEIAIELSEDDLDGLALAE